MKIRSVELVNFRKFVGTVRVDNIGDNVSVLVGENELGKSTLLQAINGAIFEKAKSTAQHVRAFRHFVNGTVPEVKLAFDIGGKGWSIHKRFAGQAGKAILTCSDQRIFEDEAAEAELQRLLGFTGGRGGGEPGIWGTLWVQQGHSFGDAELDEQARRTMQGCLEAQVGAVTGGTRGQKLPKAVRDALEEICSTRGPRGKFKDVMDRLDEVDGKVAELEAKRKDVFQFMEDLARNKRELKEARAGWDEEAHRAEIDGERSKRTAAATRAAEIAGARSAAGLARERATNARQMVHDRAKAISELEPLESQLKQLDAEAAGVLAARTDAKSSVDAGEQKLAELRAEVGRNGERTRRLERVRAAVLLNGEIKQHQLTLDKSVTLENEAARISEMIGSIAATDDAVTRIEEAVTEMSATEAATNAVATTVYFAIEKSAQKRVLVDEQAIKTPSVSFPVLGKTVIAIRDVGTIIVEPQIKNRNALLARRQEANDEMKAALETAGVRDLAAARVAAAQRKEHERRLAEIRKETTGLAPGNRSKKLAAGLDALKINVGELRGRLKAEMQKLTLATLPEEEDLGDEIQKNHEEGAQLATDIELAEAELAGPEDMLAQADRKLRSAQERLAGLNGAIDTKKADLQAGRASSSDAQLTINAETLESEAAGKEDQLAEQERNQGESLEAIDARIKRLEGSATNHQRSVADLGREVTRLTALIEANATVILDDALAFSDDQRIESMFDVLMRAGEQVQIIVLTCRKRLFTRLGAAPLEIRKAA